MTGKSLARTFSRSGRPSASSMAASPGTKPRPLARSDLQSDAGAAGKPPRPRCAAPRINGFGKQPRWPLGLGIWAKLSATACKLFGAIVYHADRQGDAWPSLRTLQAEAGLSRPTTVKAMRELKAKKLIRPTGRMRRGVVKYRVVAEPPSPPHAQSVKRTASPRSERDARPDHARPVSGQRS